MDIDGTLIVRIADFSQGASKAKSGISNWFGGK